MRKIGPFLPLLLVAAACGGQTNPKSSGAFATTGNATGTEVFTPAQVQAARSRCNQPDGPVMQFATYGQLRDLVVGSWLACSVNADPADTPASTEPIVASRQYIADGTWVNLALDASGGLVRVYGVDNQGTWGLGGYGGVDGDAGDTTALQAPGDTLYLWFDSGGGNGGQAAFESAPTRMVWSPDYFTESYVSLSAH